MSGRRFDFPAAIFGFAATGCVAIGLAAVGWDEVGVVAPFGAYFAGLAWWRLRGGRPETTAELDAQRAALLEERVSDLEMSQRRLDELEERLDFAERLLARQRDPEQLPGR
jgi:hypothetical protein